MGKWDIYVLLMKKELLLEQGAVSFGFLGTEQRRKYVQEMGGKDEWEKKRIDLDTLQKELNGAECAVREFDPCYKDFIASVMECMDRNNSDFMAAFEKLLRTFMDDKVKKAWEAVSCYSEDVKAVYEVWKDTDEALSLRIKEEEPS